MPSFDAMLAAYAATFGDDTDRLVFADWLEERGDPRAPLAREATQIDVQAVADALHYMRYRPASDKVADGMISIALLGPAVGLVDIALKAVDDSRRKCLREVQEAIRTRKIPSDIVRAITVMRRAKVTHLLEQFKETP